MPEPAQTAAEQFAEWLTAHITAPRPIFPADRVETTQEADSE